METSVQSTNLIPETSFQPQLDQKNFIQLNEIVENAKGHTISLPTVQRGFVWKPYQIENLWDSLLRGYPIGAFVLSKKINSKKNEFELLDGQQRASAICLGFYDPLKDDNHNNHKIFKTSNDNIMVFIDLLKPEMENDNRKYLFRVITKSHPWGYRKRENQKILEAKDRNKAMSYYQIENNSYFKKPLKEFWPYDSYEPIPLGLFINATDVFDLKKSIDDWKNNVNFSSNKIKEIKKEKVSCYKVEEIFDEVKKMLTNQKVPLLFLDSSHIFPIEKSNGEGKSFIKTNEISTDNEPDKEEISDDNIDDTDLGKIEDRNISEVENLFIRLNSGGTPLRGEELNYSVLKAHISRGLQSKIEERSKGLFYPARFITIAFRLFNNLSKQNIFSDRDSINMKIKPKQFQRLMKDGDRNSFINFLEEFLTSNYIDKIKEILIYNKVSNPIGLPSFIAYSIADKSPEIMFMLLYRLYIKKDEITDELKPRVLGLITLFIWLGKGYKQKDHGKLLENIWQCVKKNDTQTFWSSETLQRAMLKDRDYEIMTPFPDLKSLKRIIPKQDANIKSMTRDKISESKYGSFVDKMFYNKDLILYAQRVALSEWFKTLEEFYLEDTNRPFDYDHICPNSYTHNKKNIPRALKDWYSSNGNFRAWPYSLNRGDQDDAPSIKLKSSEDLLNSFCKKNDWLELKEDIKKTIRDNHTAKRIINSILNRNRDICLEWYDKLKINDLVPSSPQKKNIISLFESVIKKTNWGRGEKEPDERRAYYLPIGEKNLYLYFSFDTEDNILKENNIYFGICEEGGSDTIKRIKTIKEQQIENEKWDSYNYYYSLFTLISFNDNSINKLFEEFYSWLSNLEFQNKETKELIINKFCKSIKNECRNKISI